SSSRRWSASAGPCCWSPTTAGCWRPSARPASSRSTAAGCVSAAESAQLRLVDLPDHRQGARAAVDARGDRGDVVHRDGADAGELVLDGHDLVAGHEGAAEAGHARTRVLEA